MRPDNVDHPAQLPLEWHVAEAARIAMQVRQSQKGDLQPMLHCVSADGSYQIVALVIEGGGAEIARAARMAILKLDPAPKYAILIIEGWTARKDLSKDDRDYRALQAGALRPSQLPPHKRGEMLSLYAESHDGVEAYANYYIEPDGSFTEMFTSWSREAGEQRIETRMRPLFLAEDMLRTMPPIQKAMFMNEFGMNQEQMLSGARKAALAFLAAGAEGTPREYDRVMDRARDQMREQIGWRKSQNQK